MCGSRSGPSNRQRWLPAVARSLPHLAIVLARLRLRGNESPARKGRLVRPGAALRAQNVQALLQYATVSGVTVMPGAEVADSDLARSGR